MKNKNYEPIPDELERIGKLIVDSAYTIYKNLGPGLLEKVYEVCLCHELKKRGLKCERQLYFPIIYDEIEFEEGLRLDILVNDKIIIEVKAIETVNPVWQAQIISHLSLLNKRLGYLINFNVPTFKQGIRRFVN